MSENVQDEIDDQVKEKRTDYRSLAIQLLAALETIHQPRKRHHPCCWGCKTIAKAREKLGVK